MPRKEERFMGWQHRNRVRACKRRRQILAVLVEAMALTLIIGLFPPLRAMLSLTAVLALLLLSYIALLAWMGSQREANGEAATRKRSAPSLSGYVSGGMSRGGAMGPLRNGNGSGSGNGAGRGSKAHSDRGMPGVAITERDFLLESGVRIIGDDVHVRVRRSGELDPVEKRKDARERLEPVAG